MAKVLFFVNHDIVVYNFRLELVERLLRDGYEVVISSPYGERIEELKALGCEFVETEVSRHGTNPLQDIKLLYTYKKILKQVKPDVVLTYTIKPNIYGSMACGAAGIPCLANITGLGTAVENGGWLQKITVLLYKYAFRKIHTVFFQNTENMQFFVERNIANRDKYALLPGSGVNLSRFSPMEYPGEETLEFVFLSRIMKEKGTDQYLEAAQYIKNKYPKTVFHVCGFCEQGYEEKLKELESAGIIQYHGMVRNVSEILEKVHCTIHPTYYPEGLSNALLESSACGRPIITTNRAGCREVIDDGVNGFIVNQKDSQDLIAKIEKFINLSYEEKKEMGLAGRRKVEKEFDRQIVVERYSEEIKRCLEGGLQSNHKKQGYAAEHSAHA